MVRSTNFVPKNSCYEYRQHWIWSTFWTYTWGRYTQGRKIFSEDIQAEGGGFSRKLYLSTGRSIIDDWRLQGASSSLLKEADRGGCTIFCSESAFSCDGPVNNGKGQVNNHINSMNLSQWVRHMRSSSKFTCWAFTIAGGWTREAFGEFSELKNFRSWRTFTAEYCSVNTVQWSHSKLNSTLEELGTGKSINWRTV